MSAIFRSAALGCNLARGVIDAVFYLMARFSEQGKGIVVLQPLRKTTDPKEAQEIIGDALPPLLAATLTPIEFGAGCNQELVFLWDEMPSFQWSLVIVSAFVLALG